MAAVASSSLPPKLVMKVIFSGPRERERERERDSELDSDFGLRGKIRKICSNALGHISEHYGG